MQPNRKFDNLGKSPQFRACHNGTWDSWGNIPLVQGSAAVGTATTPVWVDSNGIVKACTPSSMSVGTATKATQDGSGNTITSTYVKKAGDTLTGALALKANQYEVEGAYGLNCQNSDIINVNSIYTSDVAEDGKEGIRFKGSQSTPLWDSFTAKNGVFYFLPKTSLNSAPFPTNPPSNTEYIVSNVTSGVDGGFYVVQGGTESVSLTAGSGNVNRGVYDERGGAWLAWSDASNIARLGENTSYEVYLGKVKLNFSGTVGTDNNTIYFA